jgi:hypothetical protein
LSLLSRTFGRVASTGRLGAKAYELPPALKTLTPRPDTRLYPSDAAGRIQTGLIALDAVHATTIGYAILPQEVDDDAGCH